MADTGDVEKTDDDIAVAGDLEPGQRIAEGSTEAFKAAIAAAQESVAEGRTVGQALEGASNKFASGVRQFEEEKVKRGADPAHVGDVVERGGLGAGASRAIDATLVSAAVSAASK